MKTTFNDFLNESDKVLYTKNYFIENIPKHIENIKIWNNAVNTATENGSKKSDYGAVTAIYNNMNKSINDKNDDKNDWIVVKNPSYWKKMIEDSNLNISQRKFYNSILKSISDHNNTMSPKQRIELIKLKNGL